MNRSLAAALILMAMASEANAAVRPVADCTGSDDQDKVQAQVDAAVDGDIVRLPTGTCRFSAPVTWSDKNITVEGAGVDVTTIDCDGEAFRVTVTDATKAQFRLTGMTISGTLTGFNEVITLTSLPLATEATSRFRLDHLKLDYPTSENSSIQIHVLGILWGLIDHVDFICKGCLHVSVVSQTDEEYNTGQLAGQTSADLPLGLGTDTAVYIEDSTMTQDAETQSWAINDSTYGGRMVVRHNRIVGNMHFQTHATRGAERGGVKSEVYNNTWTGAGTPAAFGAIGVRSGTGVVFNNTITGNYTQANILIDNQRSPTNDGCAVSSPPLNACDGTSAYDGNLEANGWPCLDQIGRRSSDQASVPLYVWMNGPQASCGDPTAGGAPCDGSIPAVVNCDGSAAAWIRTTPHENGEVDYCVGTTAMPTQCGTHLNDYLPYPYPHPLQGGLTLPAAPSDLSVTPTQPAA